MHRRRRPGPSGGEGGRVHAAACGASTGAPRAPRRGAPAGDGRGGRRRSESGRRRVPQLAERRPCVGRRAVGLGLDVVAEERVRLGGRRGAGPARGARRDRRRRWLRRRTRAAAGPGVAARGSCPRAPGGRRARTSAPPATSAPRSGCSATVMASVSPVSTSHSPMRWPGRRSSSVSMAYAASRTGHGGTRTRRGRRAASARGA